MEYEIIRSNRKTMAIQIKQGWLIVRVPWQATNEEINACVLQHKKWIETHLAKAQEQQQAAASVEKLSMDEIR